MKFTRHLKGLGVCVLTLSAAMAAQSSLSTYVQAGSNGGVMCSDTGQAKADCTGGDSFANGTVDVGVSGSGSTNAGFGLMTAVGHSTIAVTGKGMTNESFYSDFATTATVEDELSIIGLTNGQIAYLSGFFSTTGVLNSTTATYRIDLGSSQYSECVVNNGAMPNCRLKLAITYNEGEAVITNADSKLAAGAPAGAVVETAVRVSAFANFTVLDASGNLINGITVIGSSGHVYN